MSAKAPRPPKEPRPPKAGRGAGEPAKRRRAAPEPPPPPPEEEPEPLPTDLEIGRVVAPLELLSFVSGVMTLEPGDVIMTGTPPGVGPVSAGQVVTIAVEGVGSLSNTISS